MTKRKGITCCSRTDHGGRVLEGYGIASHKGHAVAGLGHKVYCPQCNGVFPIVQSVKPLLAYAPAVEGMRTGCGARLIGAFDDFWIEDDSGLTDIDLPTQPLGDAVRTQAARHVEANTGDADDVSSVAFEAMRTADAVHVVIRVGVFHDGTGNNFTNSLRAHDACDPLVVNPPLQQHPDVLGSMFKSCLKREGWGEDSASYGGDETNVHRLYDLYKVTRTLDEATTENGCQCVYRHVYVEGIATLADHQDSLLSGATGYGPTGVIARAEEAILKVVDEIRTFLLGSAGSNIIIDAIEFDLFGFSRGAAATRHFANLIFHAGSASPMAKALREAGLPLKSAWGTAKDDLKIRFIGLFESVAAMGIPGNDKDDPAKLYLPKDCADRVIHLIADDECRHNFALNHAGSHKEIRLHGVHSDIGGGYTLSLAWEHLLLGQPQTSTEAMGTLPTDSDAWWRASRDMDKQGWYPTDLLDAGNTQTTHGTLDQKLFIQTWTGEARRYDRRSAVPERCLFVTAAAVLQRYVRGEYQLIPLRIMHTLAQEAGVPFNRSPDDVPAQSLPSELQPIYQKLMAYARRGGALKGVLSKDEERLLRTRYLHQSAHWNPLLWKPTPHKPDGKPWGAELLYAMRPAPERKRNTFLPKPGH
ncbi:DUF2235 domain-containing protein [Dyella sp. C11]|uniref:PAAR domain-containing protein n=1 Tax=Dyella sp. C11 TaxID=2126991 RepID=UPI0018E59A29|nr:DUF2235 domain-containing protein [Dyella sp. C11]